MDSIRFRFIAQSLNDIIAKYHTRSIPHKSVNLSEEDYDQIRAIMAECCEEEVDSEQRERIEQMLLELLSKFKANSSGYNQINEIKGAFVQSVWRSTVFLR